MQKGEINYTLIIMFSLIAFICGVLVGYEAEARETARIIELLERVKYLQDRIHLENIPQVDFDGGNRG